jgi:DNA polymerase-3 subunit delta'
MMAWKNIIGQRRAIELLKGVISSGEIAHAYLFTGQPGIGKDALALQFAKAINCERNSLEACDECSSCRAIAAFQHPDVKFICSLPTGKKEEAGDNPIEKLLPDQYKIFQEQLALKAADPYYQIEIPRATEIRINSIRLLRKELSLSPYQAKRKIVVVSEADRMNEEASTALLKTLEEPPGDSVLILTSSQKEGLLSTIRSRCQILQCELLQPDDIKIALIKRDQIDSGRAGIVANLAEGSYKVARSLISEDVERMRAEAADFLRHSLAKKTHTTMKMIEEILGNKDRADAERWLRVLQTWLRDALLLQQRCPVLFLNDVDRGNLVRFTERLPRADLLGAIDCIETSIERIGQNVYLPLLMVNISIAMKNYLRK